jgi:uncharacterized protein
MSEEPSLVDPPSPCVRNCCLDEQDICLGCGRSLGEICRWSQVDAVEKARTLALAKARREARNCKEV